MRIYKSANKQMKKCVKFQFLLLVILLSNIQLYAQFNSLKDLTVIIMTSEKITFFTSKTLFSTSELLDTTMWPIKQIVVLNNDSLQQLCSNCNLKKIDKSVIDTLLRFINSSEYAWNANILLYAITQSNAIELSIYAPDKYELWEKERKNKDIELWENYLKNM
ncbi:hypothetical protein LJC68_10725, partial [Bacteroidales bacterium OttesenSCG-928-B11]|nr:hypothetical protein [Bacteroidales bacterium OttesenSCG-928-E04]MDL2313335.1 hypothetical protein [Bacteroidales bacterium OttesenSCG-928-B11]